MDEEEEDLFRVNLRTDSGTLNRSSSSAIASRHLDEYRIVLIRYSKALTCLHLEEDATNQLKTQGEEYVEMHKFQCK